MLSSEQREEFARKVIELVRDNAISDADSVNCPGGNGIMSKRWCRLIDRKDIINDVIPDVVDIVIYHLLYAIDNEFLSLSYTDEKGDVVDLSKSKELAGWFILKNDLLTIIKS